MTTGSIYASIKRWANRYGSQQLSKLDLMEELANQSGDREWNVERNLAGWMAGDGLNLPVDEVGEVWWRKGRCGRVRGV